MNEWYLRLISPIFISATTACDPNPCGTGTCSIVATAVGGYFCRCPDNFVFTAGGTCLSVSSQSTNNANTGKYCYTKALPLTRGFSKKSLITNTKNEFFSYPLFMKNHLLTYLLIWRSTDAHRGSMTSMDHGSPLLLPVPRLLGRCLSSKGQRRLLGVFLWTFGHGLVARGLPWKQLLLWPWMSAQQESYLHYTLNKEGFMLQNNLAV